MEKILEVKDLQISFDTYAGKVKAIRGVSFDLKPGETLAIVGESGSGKSVTSRSIMRLLANNANIEHGEILFKGQDIVHKTEKEMQKIRGSEIAMIFQDPMTSLNPTQKIGKQIAEPILKHQNVSKEEAYSKAEELLKLVGIPEPAKRMKQYPHQFSGGQRQRIVIAIALGCNPDILIADEPTTALDVTIQAQILELMKDLQQKIKTSIIFITHDLGVVANVADRVAVMYAGKIVEVGTVDEIFYNPQHPYTWGLLSSMPTLDTAGTLYAIPGTPPDLLEPPKGDAFAPRSEYAMKVDTMYDPPFFKVSETHQAATWLLHPDAPKVTPPIGIQNRQANFASIHLEPSEELAEMGTMDKEKVAKPKTDEPEIDPKLTEKGGLM
ncbi:abc transporter [Trichococcus palustris]|jgi:oligopeptide transport system ATP-binding protein|uniref:Abc transporter n=1 Tax=Trichococcus palustris TaxID=140314 RepID=A0A143YC58_9LACT|nr:ABC transporter ATP-binding protein [Trichococcus palustris]CZQ85176.1 abc transporter [Trichococcus palustris]SFK55201.1 oligopeptide transport system ATP-binding protein [Trichococcus palustris]